MNSRLRAIRDKLKGAAMAASLTRPSEQAPLLSKEERQERDLRRFKLLQKGVSLAGDFVGFAESNRALRLCLMAIVLYFVVAIVAFSIILEPDWTIVDSLYFAVVTFTTVGYGDLVPTSEAGQIFTIFFVLFGIIILGVALGILGDRVVKAQEHAIRSVKSRSESRVMNMFSDDEGAEGDQEIIEEEDDDDKGWLMRDTCECLVKDGPILLIILLLSLIMGHIEGWSYPSTFYYAIITTTTVGYGDLDPDTQSMRLFAVFFIPFSVAMLGNILGRIAGFYMDRQAAQQEEQFMKREFTLADLRVMDADGDGGVSLGEFLSFMLVAMQKVDKESIDELVKLFRRLDADGSGMLQKEDLILLAKSASESRSSRHLSLRMSLARSVV